MTNLNFNLSLDLGADAMQTTLDVADALERVAAQLRSGGGWSPGWVATLRDANGNTVGSWSVSADDADEPSAAEVIDHALMQGATREEVADLSVGELIERFGSPANPLGAPPEHLADAWQRFQTTGNVTETEARELDEWRAERAEEAGY